MDHYIKTDLGMQVLKQRSFQLNARQRQLLLLIGTEDFRILSTTMKQRLATPEILKQLEELGLIFLNRVESRHTALTRSDLDTTQIVLDLHAQQNKTANNTQNKSEVSNNFLPKYSNQIATPDITTQTISNPFNQQMDTETIVSTQIISTTPAHLQSLTQNTATAENFSIKENIESEDKVLSFEDIQHIMMNLLKMHCGLMAKQLILKIQNAQNIRDIKLCQMQWITALQETRIAPAELNQNMQQINRSLQFLQAS